MHLNLIPELLQLLMDVSLDLPWLFTHPLELDEKRATSWKPEETIGETNLTLHVKFQVLNPQLIKDPLTGVSLDNAL